MSVNFSLSSAVKDPESTTSLCRSSEMLSSLVFTCDVLHMVENRPAFLRNIIPALKPGGKVAVIEFYRREAPVGPPMWAKLSEEEAEEDFLQEGLKLDRKLTFLPYQYLLIFTK